MHRCIRNPGVNFGARGTREEAEQEIRALTQDNLERCLRAHRTPEWRQEKTTSRDMGNGKAIHPNLRRFMRLIEQEAHRRGITV